MSFTNNKQNRLLIIKLRNYGKNKNHESDRIDSHGTICHVRILHSRFVFAGIFCLRTNRFILQNKSHPDSNKSHPGYHQATGLAARPYSFMGNIPLHTTSRRKIATTLQRGDGALLCALIYPGSMLQSSSCNDDAERTDYPDGFHTHLDRKHDGPDFRHRLPGSRLPSVQQAQGQHAQTGHSPCPGFHRMAAMLESPPGGSVLSGRQHPADSLHLHESHQYDNNDIGLYIRLLHDVSGDKNEIIW